MSERDVLDRAQTALENIADWDKRYGKGINLVPIITDLAEEVRTLRAALDDDRCFGCGEVNGSKGCTTGSCVR